MSIRNEPTLFKNTSTTQTTMIKLYTDTTHYNLRNDIHNVILEKFNVSNYDIILATINNETAPPIDENISTQIEIYDAFYIRPR